MNLIYNILILKHSQSSTLSTKKKDSILKMKSLQPKS